MPLLPSRYPERIDAEIASVERDIVENVISRETFGFSVEYACDEVVAARVMIEDPRREADRRVGDSV